MEREEDRFLLILISAVSIALALLIRPLFGAILWAVILAIMFRPLNDRIAASLGRRRAAASAITLLVIVLLVVAPAVGLGFAIVDQLVGIYTRIQAGGVDLDRIFRQIEAGLPDWAVTMLRHNGFGDLDAAREQLVGWVAGGFQTIASRALLFSQGAFAFLLGLGVALYLAFFLLKDGDRIAARMKRTTPLSESLWDEFTGRIVSVIRATVKGSFVVAAVQGALGGLIFWILGIEGALLWSIAMGILSLIPAIGSGFVWVPVALYLLLSGAWVKGVVLLLFGFFVIGLVDNILRPILVGRDTKMPDYVIFISTIGGIQLFGINGVVVGPMIAALFIAVWGVYTERREKLAGVG